MKIFKLPKLAEQSPESEHCLCAEDTGSGNLKLTYGRLHKDATGKRLEFPEGTEGYFYVIKGNVTVKTTKASFLVGPGEAFYSKDKADYTLDNSCNSTVEYIQAVAGLPLQAGAIRKETPLKTAQQSGVPEAEDSETDEARAQEDDGLLITRDDSEPEGA